jgi:hypothetical protein
MKIDSNHGLHGHVRKSIVYRPLIIQIAEDCIECVESKFTSHHRIRKILIEGKGSRFSLANCDHSWATRTFRETVWHYTECACGLTWNARVACQHIVDKQQFEISPRNSGTAKRARDAGQLRHQAREGFLALNSPARSKSQGKMASFLQELTSFLLERR